MHVLLISITLNKSHLSRIFTNFLDFVHFVIHTFILLKVNYFIINLIAFIVGFLCNYLSLKFSFFFEKNFFLKIIVLMFDYNFIKTIENFKY